MRKITKMAAVALVTLVGWQANAQNGGDDCASAVAAAPGIFTDTTITDTTPGTNNGDSAWFTYTAAGDGTITIDSGIDLDEPDTRLFILDNCTDLTVLDSDDDSGPGFTSLIEDFPVTSGTSYIIQWDDRWSVAPFDWELSFIPAPTGDNCAEALPVSPGIILDAQINDVTPGTNNGDSLWYVYTPTENGAITVNSGIDLDEPDTRLFIIDNCTDLTVLDSDDDSGPGFTSTITDFPVVAGTPYLIQWDDRWSVAPFDWELSFSSCPTATDFAVAAGETDAVFTWVDAPEAVNGYTLDVYANDADPMVDAPLYTEMVALGVQTVTATGLTDTTSYDAYLTGDCDTSGLSTALKLDFSTTPAPPVCGGKFYDTGGPDNDFMNNEDYQVTILPDNAGDAVTASFVFVDTGGGGFDMLMVDIGDGTFVQVPEVAAGDPPVVYTSIAADGSLLFDVFTSGVVPNPGWDADITCAPAAPMCDVVANIALSNITDSTVDVSWDESATAADGYQLVVFLPGTDDTAYVSGIIPQNTPMGTATGLLPDSMYEARVTSICDLNSDPLVLAFSDRIPFTTDILGIEDNSTIAITVFPNPTSGVITLTTNEVVQSVVVSSILGQEVLTMSPNASTFEINLSNVAAGTYFVKATSNGATSVHKIIKE